MPDDGAAQTSARTSATACRLRRERLESLLAGSPAVLYTCAVTPPFGATFISDNVTVQLGYAPAQFTREPDFWAGQIHPDDAAAVREKMDGLFARGQQVLEYRFRHADGSWRWMRDEMRVVRDAAGRPVEIAGYWIDITARKRAEVALRERESLFRSLSTSSPVGIVVNDKEGRAIYANPRVCEITGLQLPEMLGEGWARILHPEDRPRVIEAWRAAVRERREFSMEHRVVTPQGVERWVHGRAAPMRSDKGELTGYVGTVEDITERKQAEERLKRFSQEILAAREQERKQVSTALHHDVGSLAVGISAHLDAIEADLRSGKPKEALKWMKRARRLFGASVARLKRMAIQLRPPELDVIGLRAALRQHFSQVTQRGGIRIEFRETLGRRRVSGETATILFRVAQEALTNAVKHGRAKRVDVGLMASKGQIRLTVGDNGKGFDPAKQSAPAVSQMGLRVMREMAAATGGSLEVDSAGGKGTTVRVSLPFKTVSPRSGKVARKSTRP